MGARQYIVLRDASTPRAAATGRENVEMAAMAAPSRAVLGVSIQETTLTEAESTSIRRSRTFLSSRSEGWRVGASCGSPDLEEAEIQFRSPLQA